MALDLTDYEGRSISYSDLNNFRRPSFDTVLQFISIPRSFEIIRGGGLPSRLKPTCHDSDDRHTQYEWHIRTIDLIFRWLDRMKEVRTILHAQVEDLGEGCDCMLKLMENVLPIYRIEVWDWRRYNVPLSTIYNATRQQEEVGRPDNRQSSVRKLNLYWRGEPECFPGDELRHLKPTEFPKVCRQVKAGDILRLPVISILIYYP